MLRDSYKDNKVGFLLHFNFFFRKNKFLLSIRINKFEKTYSLLCRDYWNGCTHILRSKLTKTFEGQHFVVMASSVNVFHCFTYGENFLLQKSVMFEFYTDYYSL